MRATDSDRPQLSWRAAAIALLAFVAITIALTFPLVLHPASSVPHDLGDPLLSVSLLWWNSHAVPVTTSWWDGFWFFPAHGAVAFSDHRLGESLLASPLQWIGVSPILAYNVTIVATFALSALAAYWLGFVLTGRHDAAAICGLAYGFSPFRIAHIEHLELLAGFAMPAALATLHRAVETRQPRWLLAFAGALIVQGLSATYYLIFFGILVALWTVWFVRWSDWRLLLGIVSGVAAAGIVLSPIAVGFARIHHAAGFGRGFAEILQLSADVTSLATASPLVALWGWTNRLNDGAERQLFPGLTIAALTVAGGIAGLRRRAPGRRSVLNGVSIALGVVAAIFAGVAVQVIVTGPWRLDFGALRVSAVLVERPLSVALLASVLAFALSPAGREGWRRRSPLMFYTAAALTLFICSFGPKPAFLGRQVLYEPPYAWLMRLPVFSDSVRAPARFAMPAIAALAAAGAIGFARVVRADQRKIGVALMTAILVDTWTFSLPVPRVPAGWSAPSDTAGAAAVLELPLGDPFIDAAAMYRGTIHRLPVVNGYSGFDPPHYIALRFALARGDYTVLDAAGDGRPLVVAVDTKADPDSAWRGTVERHPGTVRIAQNGDWLVYRVPTTAAPEPCRAQELPFRQVFDDFDFVPVGWLIDHDARTAWGTRGPQQSGDELYVDLGEPARPCQVELAIDSRVTLFPRWLDIDTSLDGQEWQRALGGGAGAAAVRGALANPTDIRMTLPFEPRPARWLRLRLSNSDPQSPWVLSGLTVRGTR